jgi:pimeloyl-ACP methyl ester carboxylesterase
MAVYVLVHGGWGGAHGFHLVRPLLHAAGHDVFTPSLTGIGERVHLTSPQVNLTTHVHDVVNCVLYEDLRELVLVGFSYSGFVVTGALEHIAERVRHLVYLDAFVPDDGQTAFDLVGFGERPAISLGEDWLVPAPERQYDDPAEAEWNVARRVSHPVGCFTEPVRLLRPLEDYPFSRTYIKATEEPRTALGGAAMWDAAERAKSSPAWSYYEIATSHMVANNRPEELAQILARVVADG